MGKLIIDGNSVYEIDEDCLERQEQRAKRLQEGRQGSYGVPKPGPGYGPAAVPGRNPRS